MTKNQSTRSSAQTESARIEFPKGGKRDDGERKVRFDLLCPEAIRHYAMTAKEGSIKYGPRNWEKGIPTGNYIDHALEHMFNAIRLYGGKESFDDDQRRLIELSHALWNIAAAIHNETGCQHHVWSEEQS